MPLMVLLTRSFSPLSLRFYNCSRKLFIKFRLIYVRSEAMRITYQDGKLNNIVHKRSNVKTS